MTNSDMIVAPEKLVTRLSAYEFNQRFEFLNDVVQSHVRDGTLEEMDSPSTELLHFLESRMRANPVSVVARFAAAKSVPICNYYIYEIPASSYYVCVMEYENRQYLGSKKKSKKEAKNSAALKLLDFLLHAHELIILDKKQIKMKEKELPATAETKLLYEKENPIPIVDCPADFVSMREEIWNRFENEGLSDPVFCPETIRAVPSPETEGCQLMNQHCTMQKVPLPVCIVFKAPTEREGKKYIGAALFDKMVFLGAISKSKSNAKNNCCAAVIDFLVRIGKFCFSRSLKRKLEAAVHQTSAKSQRLNSLHELSEDTIRILATGKPPISLLHEVCSKYKFTFPHIECQPVEDGMFLFRATAVFEEIEFASIPGARKRDAMNDLAVKIIDYLFRNEQIPAAVHRQNAKVENVQPMETSALPTPKLEEEPGIECQSLFDLGQKMIYEAIWNAFDTESLMENSSNHFAGIYCLDSKTDTCKVISWATGNGFNLQPSNGGSIINDCYAEILARRGFLVYLLDQVKEYMSGAESVFYLNDITKRLQLQPEYSFHLFASSAPIGDGARCPDPHGQDSSNVLFPVPDAFVGHGLGTLSYKGNGKNVVEALPVPPSNRSMSSCDKVLKWNVCGLQGAALFHLVEPIYLSTISVEKNYDARHLSRALYARAKLSIELNFPFAWNKPMIIHTPSNPLLGLPQFDGNAQIMSANWNSIDEGVEMISYATGMSPTGQASRLSKFAYHSRFRNTVSRTHSQLASLPYEKIKMDSTMYQEASRALKKRLTDQGLGSWVKKGPSIGRISDTDFSVDDF